MTKCKNCNCNCHCSLKEHGDMYGVCNCMNCEHEECETCQQIQKNVVVCTQKKKKTTESVVKRKTKKKQRSKMNKLYLVLALLFALSACSVGKKCTYTQDGTKLSSYVWFYSGDKPIDLDKNNCNQDE